MPVQRSELSPSTSNAMMGLSGLDTASMLDQMMLAYRKPITVAKQKQQIVIWRQEAYRSIISKLHDFKSRFFDYKNPLTNMLALGNFKKFTVDNSGPAASSVKVSATSDAKPGVHTIEVKRMPVATSITGTKGVTQPMIGATNPDWASAVGYTLTLNMDGIVRNIDISSSINSAASLQSAIDDAFGVGMIEVTDSMGMGPLEFKALGSVNQIVIYGSARYDLGFGSDSNTSNRLLLDSSLSALNNNRLNQTIEFEQVPSGSYTSLGVPINKSVVKFSINGKEFQFDAGTSLGTVIDTINNDSDADVTIKYDNATDSFKMTAKICGPGNTINIKEETSTFFSAIGIQAQITAGGATIAGDAMTLPGLLAINAAALNAYTFPLTESPMSFSVNINGIVKTIELDGYLTPGDPYPTPADIADHINDQIQAKFGDRGLTVELNMYGAIQFVIAHEYEESPSIMAPYANPITQISFGAALGQTDEQAKEALEAIGFDINNLTWCNCGEFGQVIIDGNMLSVDRTSFIYQDIDYSLIKETTEPMEFTIGVDTSAVVDMIKQFVSAYNEIISLTNLALSEKRDSSYQPLTDAQKDQMSEKEIEKWEERAKQGILRSDVNFISLNSKMRMSLFSRVYPSYDSTDYIKMSLDSIGIFSGSYQDGGVLTVNEEMLTEALENDLDGVARFFSQQPEVYEYDEEKSAAWNAKMEKAVRNKTGGIVYKMFDIIEEYARTTRDSTGQKGTLIEHAGIANDLTDITSMLSKQIFEYDDKINKLWERYDMMEKRYIKLLSQLESYVTTKSMQGEWLMQQMNSNG